MTYLQGLHGAVAIVLLCSLLFAEEAGVPIPFAPGEVVLMAGGLLIAAGGLDPVVFVPLAIAASLAGAVVGYSWARLVGEHGLTTLARRLRQAENLARVSGRIRSAGPRAIAVSRLIPGLRIYTSLVAGAAGVDRRTFLLGVVPPTVGWVGLFVVLGAVVGLPVEHFVGEVQRLAIQGGILIAIGLGSFIAIRRVPAGDRAALVRMPDRVRLLLALAVDLGLVASMLSGVVAVVRRVVGAGLIAGWADALVVAAGIGIFYLIITRRGTGATAGEALLRTTYIRHHRARSGPVELGDLPAEDADLLEAATLLRLVADVSRLRLLRQLLAGERSSAELARETGLPVAEVVYHLGQLWRAQLVVPLEANRGEVRYAVPMGRPRDAVLGLLTLASAVDRPALAPSG
ncbi:MAG TPA: DedA family protein [Candidatus Dormibacteraeota bacterium]|nr:DedA family protein [Candidatus Dormibacteraeota bacterium]